MAWESLGIPQSELANVGGEREVYGPLLKLPLKLIFNKKLKMASRLSKLELKV